LTYYLYIDIINLIELLKGVTALENQYLTKKVVLRSVILFVAFIGIKLILSKIIPGIFDAFFYTIPFLLVVIPVFYKQLGIKKTIAYSALSMVLITVIIYTINSTLTIIFRYTYDVISKMMFVSELISTLFQTAALFLALLISFKLITKSINIVVKYNFLTFVILAVYLILELIINYLGDKALSGFCFSSNLSSYLSMINLISTFRNCSTILVSLFIFITSLQLIKIAVIKQE